MSLTTLRNLANTDFASGTGITANLLRTVISAILDVFSKNISYSASIPFNCGASNMGQQILSANTVFTVNSTDATPGMVTILRLQGDGAHTPDLTAFKVIEGTYVNTSGTNNLLLFCFDGTDYTVSIKQIPSTGGTGAGDTTPPVLTGISVLNSAPSQVVLQYSETLGAVTPASSSFSFPTGGGTISSVVISGSQVLLNLSAPIGSGTTNTLTYTPGTNKIQDTSGNLAASFTNHSITNSVGSTAPSVTGINVHDATNIDVGFDMSVTGGLGGWSFTKNGSAYAATAISSPAAATLRFTFGSNMVPGDTLLASYNSGTGNTQNGSSVPLASFTNHSVTNGLSSGNALVISTSTNANYTGGVLLPASGTGTAWGLTTVLWQKKLAAATDGYLQFLVQDSADKFAMIGFKTSAVEGGYPTFFVSLWVETVTFTVAKIESGTPTAPVTSTGAFAVGDIIRLNVAGSVIKCQKLVGGVGSPVDLFTFTNTRTADLFPVTDLRQDGELTNPEGVNLV